MKSHLIAAVAMGATAALVTCAGCSEKSSTPASSSAEASSSASSSSTPSSSAQGSAGPVADRDYTGLLISADLITAPGDTFTAQEPTVDPGGKPGVATVFSNAAGTREIGDTIFVLPDAEAATTAVSGAVDAFGSSVVGGTAEPVQVGTGSTMISGTSPDGSRAVTVLVFAEQTAFVTLQFDSLPDDPVPSEFVLDVAAKQDEAIRAGLAG